MIEHAEKHALGPYGALGLSAKGALTAERGDRLAAIDLLRAGIAGLREAGYHLFCPFFLAGLAEILAAARDPVEALVEIDEALRQIVDTNYLWFLPEALRVKGQLLAAHLPGPEAAQTAESLFRRSIEQAQSQQALYWELRSSISLAELLRSREQNVDARAVFAPVYSRFTEGFDTKDLRRARVLLEELDEGSRR